MGSSTHQLAEILPKASLEPRALAYLEKHRGPVAIAVSGGVDSVCLLYLVLAHFPNLSESLTVLHYNHNTREDAGKDASFVQSISESLGLPCIITTRKAASNASEDALRKDRMAFYQDALSTLGAECLIQGHHGDDVLESMLMRITRGSGRLFTPKPLERHENFLCIRPLLSLSKEKIREAMELCKIPWREDSSNKEDTYFRNRVRKSVTEPLKASAKGYDVIQSAGRTRKLLEEDSDALELWAEKAWSSLHEDAGISQEKMKELPPAILRRVLKRWLLSSNAHLTAKAFDDLLTAIYTQDHYRVSAGAQNLELSNTFLNLKLNDTQQKPIEEVTLTPENSAELPYGTLKAEYVLLDDTLRERILAGKIAPKQMVFLNTETEHLPLVIRSWQPGDAYKPLGAPGHKKLQDLFIDNKIQKHSRAQIPVVCGPLGIIWCPGLPPSDIYRLTAASKQALRLTYIKA